jgi:hypothetical protein
MMHCWSRVPPWRRAGRTQLLAIKDRREACCSRGDRPARPANWNSSSSSAKTPAQLLEYSVRLCGVTDSVSVCDSSKNNSYATDGSEYSDAAPLTALIPDVMISAVLAKQNHLPFL